MRDPRKDPRPGDVLRLARGWTREITGNDGTTVRFIAKRDGNDDAEFSARLESWEEAMENIAEVLHVAD